MATLHDLAEQVKLMSGELARRVDDCVKDGDMTQGGAECMGGILEWLSSFEKAVRYCNLRPSPQGPDEPRNGRLDPDEIEALEKLFEYEFQSALNPKLKPVMLRPLNMANHLIDLDLVRKVHNEAGRLIGHTLTLRGNITYCDWAEKSNPAPDGEPKTDKLGDCFDVIVQEVLVGYVWKNSKGWAFYDSIRSYSLAESDSRPTREKAIAALLNHTGITNSRTAYTLQPKEKA